MRRLDAAIGGVCRVIGVGLTRQHVAGLRVTALEFEARRADQRHASVGAAVDVVPEILALKNERSVGRGGLDAVDLRAGGIGDRAG